MNFEDDIVTYAVYKPSADVQELRARFPVTSRAFSIRLLTMRYAKMRKEDQERADRTIAALQFNEPWDRVTWQK